MIDPKIKILVADDIAMSRRLVINTLHGLGFSDITEVEDGEQAWIRLERAVEANQPFKLILCDWNMPGMTGVELLKRVRAHQALKQLAFVMITGKSEKDSVIQAISQSVSAYLVKPFSPGQLQEKIAALESALAA